MLLISFSDFYISHRTRNGNFLTQIDQLTDWQMIAQTIRRHYTPVSDGVGRRAYPGLSLLKMLLVGLWHVGLSDQAVEDHDVPDHSLLSGFRTKLTQAPTK